MIGSALRWLKTPHGLATASAVAASSVLAWPVAPSFHNHWSGHPYTHGYLVFAFSLWFLYREAPRIDCSRGPWTLAYVGVFLASVLWAAAAAANVVAVHQLIVPAMVFGGILAVCGLGALSTVGPVALLFTLALPVWTALVPPLQFMTKTAAAIALAPLGIPAEIDGYYIQIPSGIFWVAESCAGISYFVSGTTIGALYAMLVFRSSRRRLLVTAIASAMSIVGNWIRVTALIIIGHVTEMQSGLVEDHGFFGWAIFSVGLIVFFYIASRLPREAAAGALDPAAEQPEGHWRAVLALVAAALTGPVALVVIGLLPAAERTPTSFQPPTEWAASDIGLDDAAWLPEYRGYSDASMLEWTNDDSTLGTVVIGYVGQRQGRELISEDNRIAPDSLLAVDRLRLLGADPDVVREAIVTTAPDATLVWYWYDVGGVTTHSQLAAKALEVLAFVRRRPRAELVAVWGRCNERDCADVAARITSFLGTGGAASRP